MTENAGKLWIVGTPIGNLDDMTVRGRKILGIADVILAEDTRRMRALLSALGISKKEVVSLNMHNQEERVPFVIERLKGGAQIALSSDAGMPVISDPGARIIRVCRERGFEVDIAPGPSAVSSALAISGFPGSHFTFLGFLPRGKNRRRIFRKIAQGLYGESVIVFFESPFRLTETLRDLLEIVGDREVFVGREMTKLFQESFFGKVSDSIERFGACEVKGEITVVLSGRESQDA
ncbi:16S rRNA (cytidine(1402)-2'-O)-methyltransferase [Mesotoga sp.]|uniref:Ribosomal RNA small subunit methyltransferase I n=1 Tax=Mesotoga infera TaxID=1236046 RepID=A0A124FU85_9BACT|nr:MAG: Ribosomal RNA small subunit methyltransferase I [Mesotoga infera]KUK85657.1 MAG: Ribosomal RNA small subunit methyltransferase I [Mesotoga infera]HCO70619.1 16S rRNA (cytidine(1402)-2'-O)-methyltransferase [Mesotoga infera]